MLSLLYGFFIVFQVYLLFLRIYSVTNESMEPSYNEKDIVLATPLNFITNRFISIKINDVIILKSPYNHSYYIKRIKKISSDPCKELSKHNNKNTSLRKCLIFNKYHTKSPPSVFYYYVEGDNRNHSLDSRKYGWIPSDKVTMKVLRKIPQTDY